MCSPIYCSSLYMLWGPEDIINTWTVQWPESQQVSLITISTWLWHKKVFYLIKNVFETCGILNVAWKKQRRSKKKLNINMNLGYFHYHSSTRLSAAQHNVKVSSQRNLSVWTFFHFCKSDFIGILQTSNDFWHFTKSLLIEKTDSAPGVQLEPWQSQQSVN